MINKKFIHKAKQRTEIRKKDEQHQYRKQYGKDLQTKCEQIQCHYDNRKRQKHNDGIDSRLFEKNRSKYDWQLQQKNQQSARKKTGHTL